MTAQIKLLPLKWSEDRPPSQEVQYDHSIAETPIGKFLLTWKSWKEPYDRGIGFDETPWGVWYAGWSTTEQAKAAAEAELARRMQSMIVTD